MTETRSDPAPINATRLRPFRLSAMLWLGSFAIIAAGIFREWYVFHFGTEGFLKDLRHIALNAEYCLPAWYSSLLLISAAGLLALATGAAARNGERYLFHWAVLAVIFAGLSADEATGVHEVAIEPLRTGLGLSGIFHFGWVIPGAVLVGLVGLAYIPFLLALPGRSRLVFFTAGAIFVGGALGMEMAGGYLLTQHGEESLAYIAAFIVEESMEIIGATLFVTGLMGHLKRQYGGAALVIA
ncbi:hypothetical protein [uncultured Parvibaculum sp.]|uniref:hypothetical protein n=1 Tax=uncultured Parvibaculum sp. TaxID=291828 RepID=UPI0030ECFD0C|tara:strand:+ start:3237 stop:3959 length:723 start_codon:yes stop_codon:yes gene_type:complete